MITKEQFTLSVQYLIDCSMLYSWHGDCSDVMKYISFKKNEKLK